MFDTHKSILRTDDRSNTRKIEYGFTQLALSMCIELVWTYASDKFSKNLMVTPLKWFVTTTSTSF